MPDDVIEYIDSDFAGSKTGWKSTGGYIFMLARVAISYLSKLQFILALSIRKAEYVAMCETEKEAVWLGYPLAELGFRKRPTPITLYANNQGSIALSKNPKFHRRTKHIDVRFYWIREVISMKKLKIIYIPTAEMSANGPSKELPNSSFLEFRQMIGM